MNKVELTKVVAETTGLSKKDAEAAVNSVFETITTTLGNNEEVNIAGFAKFGVKPTAARKGRNPQTGEEIEIAASKKPTFKAHKALKDTIK